VRREILLMRDVVDNQLLDSSDERITKVAGVEAELRGDARPVVTALLVGPGPLARRIGPRIGRLAERIIGGGREVRIPWQHVRKVGPDVRLNVPAGATSATRAEDWVREKIIGKMPGSSR
jgi:sporulation protein YlmC with PRC-barrel domain